MNIDRFFFFSKRYFDSRAKTINPRDFELFSTWNFCLSDFSVTMESSHRFKKTFTSLLGYSFGLITHISSKCKF